LNHTDPREGVAVTRKNWIRRFVPRVALGIAFASLVGCASPYPDIAVSTETTDAEALRGERTYSYLLDAAVLIEADRHWTPPGFDVSKEIRFLIDRELRAQGLNEVSDGGDLLLAYGFGLDMEALDIVEDGDELRFESRPRGTLAVVLIDANERRRAWTGYAEADVSESPDTDTAKARLDYAVSEMFKSFPR
jgi:hypothetical protein